MRYTSRGSDVHRAAPTRRCARRLRRAADRPALIPLPLLRNPHRRTPSPEAQFQSAKGRYTTTVAATVAEVARLGDQLAVDPTATPVLEALRREVHRIHGSAGGYGFADVSALADALEQRVVRWIAHPQADAGSRATQVHRFVATVEAVLAAVEGAVPGETPLPPAPSDDPAVLTVHAGATLLLASGDPALREAVQALAAPDGLRVVSVPALAALPSALATARAAAVLLDVDLGAAEAVEVVEVLRRSATYRTLPLLLVGAAADAAWRERAFAAGADDVVLKPLGPTELRHRLAQQLERRRWQRLGEGWHPVLDVAVPSRTASEGPTAWSALGAGPGSLAVLRVPGRSGDAAWVAAVEALRGALADVLGFAGFLDGDLLVLTSPLDAEAFSARLRDLPGAAGSAAGVVGAVGTKVAWDEALRRAQQALEATNGQGAAAVHSWRGDASMVVPQVIIVDDDPVLGELLRRALQVSGHTYQLFADGRSALEALLALPATGEPPVVLLDIDLPGLDGHSLHDRLRVERPGAYTVVFLSSHAAEAEQLRALQAGALDFLIKPINLRVLLAKLARWTARGGAAS
jgi:DNA-binding response OmpR family regulator/HPt (histidine-containing phosphotransfer) domain-containing protein